MKKKYLIVGIISTLVLMVGFSYAYFVGGINKNVKTMTASSKRLAIVFTDSSEINEESIDPGWKISKTFTVENLSSGVFFYDINIEELINTFETEGYLQYKITSDKGYNMEGFANIPKSEEARKEKLAEEIKIEVKEKHTYTIEFHYINDTEVNQSIDMGKEFSGRLSITESNLNEDINIIAYTYNGKKTDIPYETLKSEKVVNKISCKNGSSASWDYENNSINIKNAQSPEYCAVDFVDGYSLNIIEKMSNSTSTRVFETSSSLTITPNARIKSEYFTATCTDGATVDFIDNKLYISNIKSSQTCEIKYKIPLMMNSTTSPDRVNDNTSACYVYKHVSVGDDKTVKIAGTTYNNCEFVDAMVFWGWPTCDSTNGWGRGKWNSSPEWNPDHWTGAGWIDPNNNNYMCCMVKIACDV